jgi:hypothetical protein
MKNKKICECLDEGHNGIGKGYRCLEAINMCWTKEWFFN